MTYVVCSCDEIHYLRATNFPQCHFQKYDGHTIVAKFSYEINALRYVLRSHRRAIV